MTHWNFLISICLLVATASSEGEAYLRPHYNAKAGTNHSSRGIPLKDLNPPNFNRLAAVNRRVASQQLFSLRNDCGKACIKHVLFQLEHVLACTDVKVFPGLKFVKGNIRSGFGRTFTNDTQRTPG